MEGEEYLRSLTVVELRAHLAREGVSLTEIPILSGGTQPRKKDLLAHALNLWRAAYEPAPLSPENPFQQRGTPPRASTDNPFQQRSESPPRLSADSPFQQGAAPTPATAPRPKSRPRTPGRRRSSYGWLDPELIATMRAPDPEPEEATPLSSRASRAALPVAGEEAWEQTPNESSDDEPTAPPQPAPVRSSLLDTVDAEYEPGSPDDFPMAEASYADEAMADYSDEDSEGEDIVVASDTDGRALSQGGFSDADSTFLTDEDEPADAEARFEDWRVNELKDYLARHKVPFIAKSRKATLVSLARAHATHLATLPHTGHAEPAKEAPASGYAAEHVSPVASGRGPSGAVSGRISNLSSSEASSSRHPRQDPHENPFPRGQYHPSIVARASDSAPVTNSSTGDALDNVEDDSGEDVRGARSRRSEMRVSEDTVPPREAPRRGASDDPATRVITKKEHGQPSRRERVREAVKTGREVSHRKHTSAPPINDDLDGDPVIDVDAVEPETGGDVVPKYKKSSSRRRPVGSVRNGSETRASGGDSGRRARRDEKSQGALKSGSRHGYDHRFSGRPRSQWPTMPALKWPTLPDVELPNIPRPSGKSFLRLSLGIVVCFILSSIGTSLYDLYLYSKRPFCDTFSTEPVLPDGRECRPCPEHGRCADGELECDIGYRRVDSRCAEDQEVSLYADHLASRASELLRDLAGQKECGAKVKSELSADELRDLLSPSEDEDEAISGTGVKPVPAPRYRSRRNRFDDSKFSAAFVKAIALLSTPESFGIRREVGGYYCAVQPRLPLSCIVRRYIFRRWRFFLSFITLSICWTYFSIRRRQLKAHAIRILSICDAARDILKEQIVSYREGECDEKFVVDTHLRAEVVGSSRTAIQLWKEAEAQLGRDTRVEKIGPITVGGHPCYVWQWRGRQSLQGSNLASGGRQSSTGSYGTPSPHGSRRLSSGSAGSGPGSTPREWFGNRSSAYETAPGSSGARHARAMPTNDGRRTGQSASASPWSLGSHGRAASPHERAPTGGSSIADKFSFLRR